MKKIISILLVLLVALSLYSATEPAFMISLAVPSFVFAETGVPGSYSLSELPEEGQLIGARVVFERHDAVWFSRLRHALPHCRDHSSQREVLAGHGAAVQLAVHVAALYPSVGVAQQDLYAFLAAQLLFVIPFYALLADIVAKLVIRIVFDV